jgi:hypothetical protein
MWARYINGEAEPLDHGWFCVKLPDTQSLHPQPTLRDARDEETHWFEKGNVWYDLPRQARSRLGTPKLVRHLEDILSNLISLKYATIYTHSGLAMNDIPAESRKLIRKSRN